MNKELVFKAGFWLWQGYLVDWQWRELHLHFYFIKECLDSKLVLISIVNYSNILLFSYLSGSTAD